MFIDFDEIFDDDPNANGEVPDAFVDYLNRDLPNGIKYVKRSDGTITITPDGEQIEIGGIFFRPTEEQKAILGTNFSLKEMQYYFYNAQEIMPLELKEEGFITINGSKISLDNFSYRGIYPLKYEHGSFFAFPSKFPPPFSITIGDDEFQHSVTIKRVPNKSIDTALFETACDSPLRLKIFVNQRKNEVKTNFSLNFSYAKSVREIVECITIYNSILEGNGRFSGAAMHIKKAKNELTRFDEATLQFWKKVLAVEEKLQIRFSDFKLDVPFEIVKEVETLYQNLIEHLPVREDQKITSISGEWEVEDEDSLKESLNQTLCFKFEANYSTTIFNQPISLPCIVCIHNAIPTNYKKRRKKYTLNLSDKEDNPQYTTTMCFIDQESLEAFVTQHEHTQIMEKFHQATKLTEFLKKASLL